jgi:hypothetical protein
VGAGLRPAPTGAFSIDGPASGNRRASRRGRSKTCPTEALSICGPASGNRRAPREGRSKACPTEALSIYGPASGNRRVLREGRSETCPIEALPTYGPASDNRRPRVAPGLRAALPLALPLGAGAGGPWPGRSPRFRARHRKAAKASWFSQHSTSYRPWSPGRSARRSRIRCEPDARAPGKLARDTKKGRPGYRDALSRFAIGPAVEVSTTWLRMAFSNPRQRPTFSANANIIGAAGLTTVFGMGTGVSPPLWSPGNFILSE